MKWNHLASGLLGAVILVHGAAASAQEQVWLQDRRYLEGSGYRAGDFEVHPGLAGEFGYDSNMFLRGKNEDPASAYRLRLTPSLSFATVGTQGRAKQEASSPSMTFRAGVAGVYNEYIATRSPDPEKLSKFRNVGALANLELEILPNRPWGGRVHGNLVRTVQPSNLSDTSAAFNRINAGGGGELIWAPGGGLFDWRLGYRYSTTMFEEARFESLNSGTHWMETRGRWRFLPRTAFVFDASQGFLRYSSLGASANLLNANPIRARLGFSGLITDRFALLGMVGWGATFLNPGKVPQQNYDGVIGQAQITFYPTAAPGLSDTPREASLTLSQVGVGYTRDFGESYLGGFYTRDRGYISASYFFAGRVLTSLQAGISRVGYPILYFASESAEKAQKRSNSFFETRYDFGFIVEYRLAESLGVNLSLNYDQNASRELATSAANPKESEDLSWRRFQSFLGARWFM